MLGSSVLSYAIFLLDVAAAGIPASLFLYIVKRRLYLEDFAAAVGIFAVVVAFITASNLNPAISEAIRPI